MASDRRRHPYRWLGTLSSGYDSPTATALGTEAGCKQAICFDRSRRNEPDSGVPIAHALGIEALEIERATWRAEAGRFERMPEVPFLAAVPTGELTPFAAARGHLEGRVLLTGFQGGAMWKLRSGRPSAQVVRKDSSGLGFVEFRLVAGFINCSPAFWTARQVADLAAIGRSEEMRPWVLDGPYQRPTARRILEEAGVPRDAFGHRKQPGVGAALLREDEFLGPESMADYRAWLRRNAVSLSRRRLLAVAGLEVLIRSGAPVVGLAAAAARTADRVVPRPIVRLVRRRVEAVEAVIRPLSKGVATRMFPFPWALERASERYFEAAGAVPTAAEDLE